MKQLITLILALVVSLASADTTNNVISSTSWTGVTNGTLPTNRMPGSALLYDSATGTVNWSYNTATASKTIAINNALSGTGIQVSGYNYTYDLRNMNGDDRQSGVDTMTVVTKMTSNTGATLISNTNTHNTKFDWTTFSGTQTLTNPSNLSGLGNLSISFTSRDAGFWSGYFGPEVKNVGMSLNYTVDPCVSNPAYSSTCPNYNTVQTSQNITAQSYAINQALGLSGSGVMIHGFNYGYDYSVGGQYCSGLQFLGCWGWADSSATLNVNLTNSSNNSIYSNSHTHSGQNISGSPSYRYLFPASRNLSTLGNVSFSVSTTGTASINNVWSNFEYTPDPCTVNPLSSTTCAGYAQAYHDQQCSVNPLYATTCTGYQAAYLTQQCTSNPLYSATCAGYATAYYNQQCSINPLGDQTCPGYTRAYHDQQCSISPLYASDCTGYTQAYHDQQCGISALYASDCTGYTQAYLSQQCSINTLYDRQCPGYQVAYKNQQCNLNPLYASDCAGYAAAYHTQQCSANPLYMSDCNGYQAAYLTQQCNISQLYSTSCPNYQQAYFAQQCQLNGLYDRSCPNYGTAYAAKNIIATPKITTTSTVSIVSETNATITSNPAVSAISDPTVADAISTPSTTSSTSPTSVTSVLNPPSNSATSAAAAAAATPAPAPAPSAETKAEAKKTENAVARAAAKGGAAAAAKDAATASANAKSMEDQVATQGLVVGLMGYVPGFSSYQNSIVPDVNAAAMARQYSKANVDNRNAQRRLSGASDAKWQEMVDSQYKIGDR